MEDLVRLNKFIASRGFSSRRKIDEMIEQGRVTVNGNTIVELGFKINPEKDRVALDGENIKTSSKQIYIILNKPRGVVTTVSDDKHRTTVIDLINIREKIFPVGRLDYNTSGLLLLTNDGELANQLMHPKGEVYKTYFVKLSKPLEEKIRIKLTGGMKLEGRLTAPAKIRYPKKNDYQDLYISIYEGRNRQVRKMFENYGYFVRDLERVEYAGLKLEGLSEGQWRYLTAVEVMHLKQQVKNTSDSSTKIVATENKSKRKFSKKYGVSAERGKSSFKKFSTTAHSSNKDSKNSEERNAKKDFKSWPKKFEDRDKKKDFRSGPKQFDDRNKEKDFRSGPRRFEDRDKKKDFRSGPKKFEDRDSKKDFRSGPKKFEDRNKKRDFKSGPKNFEDRDKKKDFRSGPKQFEDRDKKKDFRSGPKQFEDRNKKRDFKSRPRKFEDRDKKKDFRSGPKKFEDRDSKKDFRSGPKSFEDRNKKNSSKWGFKKRTKDEREVKLGFKKFDAGSSQSGPPRRRRGDGERERK